MPILAQFLLKSWVTILINKKVNFHYLLWKYQLNISAFSFVLRFVIRLDRYLNSSRLVNISLPKYKRYSEWLTQSFIYKDYSQSGGHIVKRVPILAAVKRKRLWEIFKKYINIFVISFKWLYKSTLFPKKQFW